MSQVSYRSDLIEYAIAKKFPNIPMEEVVKKSPVCGQTVNRILRQKNVSVKTLKSFTDFLGLVWHRVFDPTLTPRQFHRAVANGNGRTVR